MIGMRHLTMKNVMRQNHALGGFSLIRRLRKRKGSVDLLRSQIFQNLRLLAQGIKIGYYIKTSMTTKSLASKPV